MDHNTTTQQQQQMLQHLILQHQQQQQQTSQIQVENIAASPQVFFKKIETCHPTQTELAHCAVDKFPLCMMIIELEDL